MQQVVMSVKLRDVTSTMLSSPSKGAEGGIVLGPFIARAKDH